MGYICHEKSGRSEFFLNVYGNDKLHTKNLSQLNCTVDTKSDILQERNSKTTFL